MKHKSYMTGWGDGWVVSSWDSQVDCYRESHSMPYGMARIAVGTDNCPHATDGACGRLSHTH